MNMKEAGTPRSESMTPIKKIPVALIGLGRIGFQNDAELGSLAPLTHYSALSRFPNIEIVAGVDINENLRVEFEKNTGVKAVASIGQLEYTVDILVIASSTELHLELMRQITSKLVPRIVICEKPVGLNAKEAIEIINLAKTKSIQLYVPYFRRYMPHIINMFELIRSRKYGDVVEVSVEYGQGLLTNGSHFVNLVDFLVGGLEIEVAEISKNIAVNPSWSSKTLKGAFVRFQGSRAEIRSGEIRIKCESGEFVLAHGGIVTYHGSTNPGSGWLEEPCDFIKTDWRSGMQDFYDQIFSCDSNDGVAQIESLESVIRTQQIVSKVLE